MWRHRAETSDNPEEELAKMDEVMRVACERGSYVHRFLEQYYKGNLKFYNEDPKILKFVNGAINFLGAFGKNLKPLEIDGVKQIEIPLINNELQFAGTPDFIGYHGEDFIILDYKTASKPQIDEDTLHKYKLQQAALVKLFETEHPEYKFDKAMLQVITDKRKNGLGEQYVIDKEELETLWLEFEVLKNAFNAELALEDTSNLVDYIKSDPIMAMDRKIN